MLTTILNPQLMAWFVEDQVFSSEVNVGSLLAYGDGDVILVVTPTFVGFTNVIYKIDLELQATFSGISAEERVDIYKVDTENRATFSEIEASPQAVIYRIDTDYGFVVLVSGGYGTGPYGEFPYGE